MIKNFLKNIVILIFLLILLVLFLEFLNLKLGGVPIYDKLKIDRNQLTYIKSKSFQINKKFVPKIQDVKINAQLIEKCGYQESGIYHMVYTPDQYGFRENHRDLYKNTDIVIMGDSFGFSSCVNRPNDLKSQLEKQTSIWEMEQSLVNDIQSLKGKIDELNSPAEQEQRNGYYQKSAKIRYSDIPEIDKQIENLNKSLTKNQFLKQEVHAPAEQADV